MVPLPLVQGEARQLMRSVAGQYQRRVTSCSASSSLNRSGPYPQIQMRLRLRMLGMALLLSSQRSGRMSSESGTLGGEGFRSNEFMPHILGPSSIAT